MTFVAICKWLNSSIYFPFILFFLIYIIYLNNRNRYTLIVDTSSVKSEKNSSDAYLIIHKRREREREREKGVNSFHQNFALPFAKLREKELHGLSLIYFFRVVGHCCIQRNSHLCPVKAIVLRVEPRPGTVRRVGMPSRIGTRGTLAHCTSTRRDGADGRIGRGLEYECCDPGADVCDAQRFLVNKGRRETAA